LRTHIMPKRNEYQCSSYTRLCVLICNKSKQGSGCRDVLIFRCVVIEGRNKSQKPHKMSRLRRIKCY
jgi:hypothetical protein